MRAMKLRQVDITDVPAMTELIVSDEWAAQQKMDGIRVMAEVDRVGIRFTNAQGEPLAASSAMKRLPSLYESIRRSIPIGTGIESVLLDGELMADGTYWVFDLVRVWTTTNPDAVNPAQPFAVRAAALETLSRGFTGLVGRLSTAWTTDQKMHLVNGVLAAGAEGVVFKRVDRPYEPGARVDHQLKAKVWKTADVVVGRARADHKRSVELFMVAPGTTDLVFVGNATTVGRDHLGLTPGTLVEVRYLYATDDRKLYGPPDILRRRDDKVLADCGTDQLQFATQDAVVF